MARLKRAIGACTLASVLFQTAAVYAATYYVAPTGSNSHPGTEKQPWQTVAHAVNTMVAGDTTYVRGGTYNEGVISFKQSGTAAAPIKLLNFPGEAPRIHCIDHSRIHRINIFNGNGSRFPIGWITIEGFEIEHCYNGIKWYNLHDSVIRRNWIHDARDGSGIVGAGSLRVVLDRNVFSHNAITDTTGTGGHGIYINGSYVTVTNNIFYDNRGYNIQLNGSSSAAYDSAKYATAEFANSNNWVIANNTIAYARQFSGLVIWGTYCNNTLVENNIFYENSIEGVFPNGINFVSTKCTGNIIRNNLHHASGSGGTAFLGIGATEGLNYTQSGNISGNPLFVNAPATLPASPNFALTERSPGIDRGLHLDSITTAFDGTTRPQQRAYDIGAYEYKAGSDSASPNAPVALKIN
jgi:Right handed beta helix region